MSKETEMNEVESFQSKMDALRNGGTVRRYHTHYTAQQDTVASHSWGVATVVDALYAPIGAPAHMLRAALYHDIAEFHCGDIPSPAKRMLHSDALKKMEDAYMRDAGLFTELSESDRLILKYADILEGFMFCSEEVARGNKSIVPVFNKYSEFISEIIAKMLSGDKTLFAICQKGARMIGRTQALVEATK